MLKKILLLTFLSIFLLAVNAMALTLGQNITIKDLVSDNTYWNGELEDQEVEPGMQTGQHWDLEGFFLAGTTLAMVGGYDFTRTDYASGDLFIDTDGDAKYGPDNEGTGSGGSTVENDFGYEYALRFNFSNFSYRLISLSSNSVLKTTTVGESGNQESNPWRYYSGGVEETGGTFTYDIGLSDSDVGLSGGSHNAIQIADLAPSLVASGNIFHFTMECGNDNLMGRVPEPATIVLSGLGLLFMGVFFRRKFIK